MPASRLRLWFRVSPYYAYHMTVVGVAIGTALAVREGISLRVDLLALTLLGILAAHTAAAFVNEYYDFVLGADRTVEHENPFAGGSRVIFITNGLRPPALVHAALLFAGLGIAVGLVLTVLRGLPVLLLGAAGYLLLLQYTAPPLKLAYRGWGEAAVGVSFGPLVVVGSNYVQSGALSAVAFAASLPLGVLVALVLLLNEFPDYDGDAAVGKRNLVVRLGLNRGVLLCLALLSTVGVLLVAPAASGHLPRTTSASLAVLVPCGLACGILARRRASPEGLVPANALMVASVLLLGIVYSWGLLA